jgi:putative membrane protein
MFVKKQYPLSGVIKWSKKYIFYFLLIDTIPVAMAHFFDCTWLAIPWQPIALIGIGVSFYLGFKNNSSYDRLWEARKIWGGIVNASRTLTVMTRDFVTNDFTDNKLPDSELKNLHKKVVHRHVAWLKALTFQLRMPKVWEHNDKHENELRKSMGTFYEPAKFEQLKKYLSSSEYDYIMSKGNKASHLLSCQSKNFKELRQAGLIDDFRHMELEKLVQEFYALQGKSERIKNFPFPRQYATINYLFVWIFILLLPFGMLNVFADFERSNFIFLAIPFTMLVSWVFILMEMIGDYSENPFEGLYNDVPISSMAQSIEIDIRQMLDEEDLPEEIKPAGEFNLLI